MLSWLYPWVFVLLPLPWLLRRRSSNASQTQQAPQLPIFETLRGLPGVQTQRPGNSRWQAALLALAWLALLATLARPQFVGDPVKLPVTGRDLLLAVDISPSMEEQDMIVSGRRVSRLLAVKHVVSDFIDERSGDRIGLILFGTQPYIQAPLTFDHPTVQRLLQESALGMAGRATAIGDAIGLAVKRLRDRPESQRVLVLLTDGANTAGEIPPEKAAQLAKESGVRVYTIAIGGDSGGGLFGLGRRRSVDEDLLENIAQTTDGRFFRARSTPELTQVYAAIDRLEPIEQEGGTYRPRKDLFFWPLALAVLLLLAGPALSRARDLRYRWLERRATHE
ncbi:VWA domain-containing protein [Marinobacteraceae bacterium S3BR75-40.1]